eukprot:1188552-Prorocentrum_minimum.AAC.2
MGELCSTKSASRALGSQGLTVTPASSVMPLCRGFSESSHPCLVQRGDLTSPTKTTWAFLRPLPIRLQQSIKRKFQGRKEKRALTCTSSK